MTPPSLYLPRNRISFPGQQIPSSSLEDLSYKWFHPTQTSMTRRCCSRQTRRPGNQRRKIMNVVRTAYALAANSGEGLALKQLGRGIKAILTFKSEFGENPTMPRVEMGMLPLLKELPRGSELRRIETCLRRDTRFLIRCRQ